MTSETDCCPGEPFMGDPNGLHTHDCPVYQANVAALLRHQGDRATAHPSPSGDLAPASTPDTRRTA